MSKTDLVNFIAEDAGLTKADATRAIDSMMKGMIKGLKDSGKVAITGFLNLATRKKAASTARNPRTGETVKVPARTVVTIKAGSKLKDALN